MKITKFIESRRTSDKLFWKFLVLLKDTIWEIYFKILGTAKHYFYLISHLNELSQIKKINQLSQKNNLLAFELNEKFFLHNYLSIYEKLKNQAEIYFIVPNEQKTEFLDYLYKFNIPQSRIISSSASLYVHWKIYLNCWLPNYYPNLLDKKKLLKIQMYHGIGTPNFRINKISSNIRNNNNLRKFNIQFMIGPQYEETLKPFNKKLFKVGYPKLDKLFNKNSVPLEIKKEIKFNNRKPIILYVPHHDLTLSLNNYKMKILDYLINTKMNIIVKFHNRIQKNHPLLKLYQKAKQMSKNIPNFHVAKQEDSTLYYPIADIVITDVATSAGPEAAICRKPVILINSEEWFDKYRRDSIEFELKQLFPTVNSIAELDKKIKSILRKKTKRDIVNINRIYFNPGKATEIAVKIIENYLK